MKILVAIAALLTLGSLGSTALMFVAGSLLSPGMVVLTLPLVFAASAYYHRAAFWSQSAPKSIIPATFARLPAAVELAVFGGALVLAIAAPMLARNYLTLCVSVVLAILLGGCMPRRLVQIAQSKLAQHVDTVPAEFGRTVAQRIDASFRGDADALVAGNLEAHAKSIYPADKYPELYADIPEDVRRPIIADGRLITGEKLDRLVPRRLSRAIVVDLYQALLRKSGAVVIAALVVSVFASVAVFDLAGDAVQRVVDARAFSAEKSYVMSAADVPARLADVLPGDDARAMAVAWNKDEGTGSKLLGIVKKVGASTLTLAGQVALFAGALASMLMLGYLIAAWRGLNPARIAGWVQQVLDMEDLLRAESVEAVVRWKKRLETRENSQRGYRNQVVAAKRDKSPLITLGEGTGTMAYRGALNGYLPGQPAQLSMSDTHQNMMITGGTGSGKTYSIILPIMSQVMRAAARGEATDERGAAVQQALFVTDGKGVLWRDAKAMADKAGLECLVIGCGDDECGVDLFGGLEPHVVSSTLNAIMAQVSGARSADPFWLQMACQIIDAATRIARAWELTDGGQAYVRKTKERIYSPVGVYALARSLRDPEGIVYRAIEDILDTYESDPESVALFATPDLWSACEFLRKDIPAWPEATVGSFLSNVTNILAGFTNLDALRRRFGGASSARILDINRIFDDKTVTAVNLSPAEWGDAGRLCNIFVKTRLYQMARLRQLREPDIGQRAKLLVVMDEAQDLVTVGGGGYSETSFLNYSRSTGLSFLIGTQTLAALYAALGESHGGQATKNLVDQFRTKIFLSAEGQETVSYMQELAGKALRSTVNDYDQYESFFAERLESGQFNARVDLIEPFELAENDIDGIIGTGATPAQIAVTSKPLVSIERDMERFYRAEHSGTKLGEAAPAVDWTEKLRTIVWRNEDKRKALMSEGNSEEDLVHVGDLTAGRGLAFAYVQRAGGVRMDIITLHPERLIG